MSSWKASGQWNLPLQTSKSNDESSYPGLKPTSPDAGPRAQYVDAQQDEIVVLQSMYLDDFIQHKAANTAWQRSEPAFDVRIKAPSNEDFCVTLGVVFTATYPKSPPLLSLKDDGYLKESTVFKVQKYLETKPQALAAQGQCEPMMYEIISGVQDILEDAAQAKALGLVLPSLEEERAAHEAELARQAEERQQANARKQEEAAQEEERVMHEMIEEEMKRQKASQKKAKHRHNPKIAPAVRSEDSQASEGGVVVFDETCTTVDLSGNDIFFTAVVGNSEYRRGLIGTTYAVRPVVSNNGDCPTLILKEFKLVSDPKEAAHFKKKLVSLENKLQAVKKLKHENILGLIDFRIDQSPRDEETSHDRVVRILMPLADKGPLDELLDLTGQIAIGKVRAWTTDLLSALGYLHSQGLVHEDIHPGNILLCREETGRVVPKLADVTYQRELHAICRRSRAMSSLSSARSVYWLPPEVAANSGPLNQKTDVWDFGVVFLQMIFGLDVFEKYESPAALMEENQLSNSLHELVSKFFKADAARRARALDLTSSEFLATDAPVLVEDAMGFSAPVQSMTPVPSGFSRKRLDSVTVAPSFSRFKTEFSEEGRLGKGGFGEVVKARKKIDGQIYAIKKISQRASRTLTTTLKEVLTLSRLSHPAIVRYYDAWIEQVPDTSENDGDTSTEGLQTGSDDSDESEEDDIPFGTSTGGLDFMSSANLGVEFEDDEMGSDDENGEVTEEDDEDDDEDTEGESGSGTGDDSTADDHAPLTPKRSQSYQRSYKNILYILMEYCENKTLRGLIDQNLYQDPDEVWRLFREILEGLVHIHGLHNLVHRDLKPENIFISRGSDGVAHVKIGDFGLATSGHISAIKGAAESSDPEMSKVGTAMYVAPELERSSVEDSRKVDMYSLGIVLFEMCYKPVRFGQERSEVLGALRSKPPRLPDDFKPADKLQSDIILSLVTHSPKERPSSSDLLRSGKLPMPMESESIQRALAEISDPLSPHYQKMVTTMFAKPTGRTKDYTWDMSAPNPSSKELLHQGIVKDQLVAIFRRHGAVEAFRNPLYPRSSHYSQNVVELMDNAGTVLQLPYDLMLGHARVLAKHTGSAVVPKSFTFGNIFRARSGGGQPLMFSEVGFDIVSTDTLDLALKEAEAIKVLDEIIDAFPVLNQMCFHIGHSDLLQLIFDICDIDPSVRKVAAEILSKLNVGPWTWQKIRSELRGTGISVTAIDELHKFDFRDSPVKAFARLKTLFDGSNIYEKAQSTIAHLKDVVAYTKRLGVRSKVYINPLSSFRENFFVGGTLFQCIYDKKFRDVFAAGGRYDSLIREHRPKIGGQAEQRHAAGFSLAWEKLAKIPKAGGKSFLKKAETDTQGIFNTKRCDVLVASFDGATLRNAGTEMLQLLWANDISAELARDSRSPEDLANKHRDEMYSWAIIIKQDGLLKVKTMDRKDVPDADMASTQVLNWLRGEMRERERSHGTRPSETTTAGPLGADGAGIPPNPEQDVKVLVANTRSKKFNRRVVVEQAQAKAAALLQGFLEGPIAAVEASDAVLGLIQDTWLSDTESWRKAEQSVNMTERKYMREIHDMLLTWRNTWQTKGGSRHAFVYNFRTTKCIYYDLDA